MAAPGRTAAQAFEEATARLLAASLPAAVSRGGAAPPRAAAMRAAAPPAAVHSSSDESDDDTELLAKQALPLHSDSDDDDDAAAAPHLNAGGGAAAASAAPPGPGPASTSNGFTFLRSVRAQTALLPDTVVSTVDPRAFDARRTTYAPVPAGFAAPPESCRPRASWAAEEAAAFASLRAVLGAAAARAAAQPPPPPEPGGGACHPPLLQDAVGWRAFCLGDAVPIDPAHCDDAQTPAADEDAGDTGGDDASAPPPSPPSPPVAAPGAGRPARRPGVRLLCSIDDATASVLLRRAVGWLERSAPAPFGCAPLRVPLGEWLFALLARVDSPLDADTGAAVRQLIRRLCAMRAGLGDPPKGGVSVDGSTMSAQQLDSAERRSEWSDALARINVLIVAAASFGVAADEAGGALRCVADGEEALAGEGACGAAGEGGGVGGEKDGEE